MNFMENECQKSEKSGLHDEQTNVCVDVSLDKINELPVGSSFTGKYMKQAIDLSIRDIFLK